MYRDKPFFKSFKYNLHYRYFEYFFHVLATPATNRCPYFKTLLKHSSIDVSLYPIALLSKFVHYDDIAHFLKKYAELAKICWNLTLYMLASTNSTQSSGWWKFHNYHFQIWDSQFINLSQDFIHTSSRGKVWWQLRWALRRKFFLRSKSVNSISFLFIKEWCLMSRQARKILVLLNFSISISTDHFMINMFFYN